jgi:lipopolysaccharide-induced tumor necrosis factor-alpha factor
MPIPITCPTCGSKAQAPDSAAGKTARCPQCSASVPVPEEFPLVRPADPEAPRPRGRRDEDDYDDRPARRRRDEDDHDDRPARRRAGGRFHCPFCGSEYPPVESEQISQAGWVLFVVLILFCIPLCWIPLISMKEKQRRCSDCGTKLG